jgi:hypothetical protein
MKPALKYIFADRGRPDLNLLCTMLQLEPGRPSQRILRRVLPFGVIQQHQQCLSRRIRYGLRLLRRLRNGPSLRSLREGCVARTASVLHPDYWSKSVLARHRGYWDRLW